MYARRQRRVYGCTHTYFTYIEGEKLKEGENDETKKIHEQREREDKYTDKRRYALVDRDSRGQNEGSTFFATLRASLSLKNYKHIGSVRDQRKV